MNKIIYISFSHLTDRLARDFYVDSLIAKGANVEFWDIVSLVREEHIDPGMKTTNYLYIIRTFSELESKLTLLENKDAYYLMNLAFTGRFMRVFRLLAKYNCRMIYIDQGLLPVIGEFKPLIQKIFNHFCHPWRLANMLFNRAKVGIYKRLGLVNPFEIVFFAGGVKSGKCCYARKMVPVNMCDYDHYKRLLLEKTRIVEYRYAVYLDVNLPFHNNLNIMRLKRINEHDFFRLINVFFDLLEKEYGLKVVIAAHPTANYDAETFRGREIIRLKTAELVKDSDFVISMWSTSTGYAVLNQKPIIFIYTNEMEQTYKESLMRGLYAFPIYLDSPIYNIDKITHGTQVLIKNINKECYDRYKYNFLTSHESENFSTPEIIWREVSGGESLAQKRQ